MKKIYTLLVVIFAINAHAQCWSKIVGGGLHSAGIKSDGTLWTWGYNSNGVLGNGTSTYRKIPTQVGASTNWVKISAGFYHTLAIKTDGTLWGWGFNDYGQLGDGTTFNRNVPVRIGTSSDWSEISCNRFNSLALKTNGTIWVWGENGSGQCAINSGSVLNPIQIGSASNWVKISGGATTLAIKSDGTLWGCGNNNDGNLGNGTYTSRSTFQQIGTDNNWSILGDSGGTIIIKTNGTLWACGFNGQGQIGDGTTNLRNVLVQVGTDTNWSSVTGCGGSGVATLATKTNGTLWGWGVNTTYQLGNGTTNNSLVPVQIGIDTNWSSVKTYGHSVALKNNGSLYTWGNNSDGQIGDNTNVDKTVPTAISCPTLSANNFAKTQTFSIVPNPTNQVLNITTQETIKSIKIIDITGRNTNITNFDNNKIDVSNLQNGIYFIEIDSENGFQTQKFIKN